ncbi:autotransporter assembly complex protein TamA [Algicella marina]|uniref:BamA/TamA family outer membrane protein n=1 Tax=Algicella marina TaxID=2683284 RepID=A0A6P1T3M9_9RHOB|nr:autotransporter assembly complex family protein [Algicella marina]QHQ36617.1 BamA/TamA family outer membrane protein [Algicella marina]
MPYQKLIAVGAIALCISAPASAFELFGFRIFEGDAENDDRVEILNPLSYTAEPDIRTSDKGLRNNLLSSSDVYQRRDMPASGSAGLIVTAKADYRRLLATLYTEGFYSGAINIRINGQEAGNLSNTTQLAEPVQVTISVDPGPEYRFGETRFENRPPKFSLGENAPLDAVRRDFIAGETARADVIDEVGNEAVDAWRRAGFPLAKVSDRSVIADHPGRRVDATITLDPGRQAAFTQLGVRGTEQVSPRFVRYMAGIERGDPFTPEAIKKARDRLTRLGIFNSVRIAEGEVIRDNGLLPVVAELRDRKPRRIGVGATLSTLDGLGLEAFWLHRNVLGRAERLRFDAAVGGIGNVTEPEDYDYLASVSYRIPGVFNPDTDLELGGSVEQNVYDLYRERSVSIYGGFRRIFTDRLDGSLFFETSYSRVEDDTGTREFLTLSAPAELTFDKRDDPSDATRGYYLSGSLTPFYEVEYDSAAVQGTLDARGYISFGAERGTVLAGRIGLGTVLGGELRDLPPDMLFFAGGGGSVRGYTYKSIGTEVDGDTLGGRSLLDFSAEIRQKITTNIGVVGFLDGGYVTDDTLPFSGVDPLLGAGLGLRYRTGLGPLRLDVGTPLNGRSGDPTVAFYIGLGQAF